jgi:hypothetical protein
VADDDDDDDDDDDSKYEIILEVIQRLEFIQT